MTSKRMLMPFLEGLSWDPGEEEVRSREGERIKFVARYSNFEIVQRGVWSI